MKIGLLGYGVVGGGVYRIAKNRRDMTVKYVLDLREFPELDGVLVHDISAILQDPEVDTVVEAMGGLHPAYEFAMAAISAGKNYVTANKHLVSHYYRELRQAAEAKGVCLRCTAAVGGGIPWLVNLERARRIDSLTAIRGIMNGTTNYILDTMLKEGIPFPQVLASAQELGYAEADPSADIDGLDIQRKLIISANVAFDCLLSEEDVPTFGIRNLTDGDVACFTEAGYVCKLVATALRTGQGVAAWVEPTLIPKHQLMAAVPANFNLISYDGDYFGTQSFYGQGAGRFPTAGNVVQDCVDILEGASGFYGSGMQQTQAGSHLHAYYVRTTIESDWLKAVTQNPMGQGVLTKPVASRQMHEFIRSILEKDSDAFIAGIQ